MRIVVLAALLAAALVPNASGQYTVRAKEDYWACNSKDVMEAVKEAVKSADQQTIRGATVLLLALSETGECFKFSKGDKLVFLDSEILNGYMVVRKSGSMGRYYTFRDLFSGPVRGTPE